MKSINENQCDYKENTEIKRGDEEIFAEIQALVTGKKQTNITIKGDTDDMIALLALVITSVIDEAVKKGAKRSTVEQNVIKVTKYAIAWSRIDSYGDDAKKGTNNAENKSEI